MVAALDSSIYPEYAAECGDPSRTKILGFGQRPALLLIDVCEAYYSERSALKLPEEMLERSTAAIESLLIAARYSSKPVPVIYTQTCYTHPKLQDAGLAALKFKHAHLFSVHNEENFIAAPKRYPAIAARPNDMILRKKYPSPFFGTNFSAQLAALGVDTLVIAGFTTSTNVRAAALDAMQSGFRPIIAAEACGDRAHETHWANLMDLGAKYGDVVKVKEACLQLQKGWST